MMEKIEILKGVHPGVVLDRELRKRHLSRSAFALSIKEYPQTLSAILNGKRNMNTPLALRIEEALELEEGFFMVLQTFYDIKQTKAKLSKDYHPDLGKFRRALFWDTNPEKIDWKRQKKAIVNRVFERGNFREKKELVRFYGRDIIVSVLEKDKKGFSSR